MQLYQGTCSDIQLGLIRRYQGFLPGEYALQPIREDTHYRCALVGALQHQANILVTKVAH